MNRTPAEKRDIIVIGGSAGGLEALKTITGLLPADFPASIFVTVHVPTDFPSLLPEILSWSGVLRAVHPSNHEPIKSGVIYVAPPDCHLLVEQGSVKLSRGPRENRHRPAIDPLFRSAARAYGPRTIGVILSGQLDDGSAGLMAIRRRGGVRIVQDPAGALSSDMPTHAIKYAGADYILPAVEIAKLLGRLTREELSLESKVPEVAVETGKENESPTSKGLFSVPKQAKPSEFSCPECHGVLWEIDDGELLRFRCRVGHAYTADALRLAVSEATEAALWAALRAMEEKVSLLRRLASKSGGQTAIRYEEEADAYNGHVRLIHKILLGTPATTERPKEKSTIHALEHTEEER